MDGRTEGERDGWALEGGVGRREEGRKRGRDGGRNGGEREGE